MFKITGVKNAVGTYKSWMKEDWRRTARIMFDLSDGKVWTDCFLDCNTWKNYHSDTIINLGREMDEREENTMANVKAAAERCLKRVESGKYKPIDGELVRVEE